MFTYSHALWTNESIFLPNIADHVTIAGSRALSAISITSITSSAVHLLYEGVNGNLSWMIGSSSGTNGLTFDWEPLSVSTPFAGKTPLRNNSGPFYLSLVQSEYGASGIANNYISYFQDTFNIETTIHNFGNASFGSEFRFICKIGERLIRTL